MKVSALLARVAQTLERAGNESAELEARWLVEAAAGRELVELMAASAAPEIERRALALAQRRARGEPLQYLTGIAGFRLMQLRVGPGVFIPRPETEAVAEQAMRRLPRGGTAVDVACGSGAIALAIVDERPDARVIATEASVEALAWATRNVEALGARVSLFEGDLLGPLPPRFRAAVDVIVSNPPYVRAADAGSLPVDVVEHEPHLALFGGRRGTEVIERLALEASRWLRPGGWIVCEIGEQQADEVRRILADAGLGEVAILADLLGRPRVAEAQLPR